MRRSSLGDSSTVLGLGALEDFEGAVKELAAEAKSRADAARDERDSMGASLSRARERLAEAEQRLQTLPQVEIQRAETLAILQSAPDFLRIDSALDLGTPDAARHVAAMIGELIDRLQVYFAAWADAERLRGSLEAERPAEELAAAATARNDAFAEVAAARDRRASVEARLASAQAASAEMARLAALAVPLLTNKCPVCGQTIDAAHVEQELRARAADTGTMLSLQGELQQARIDIQNVEAAANDAENHVRSMENLRRQWDEYRQNQHAADSAFSAIGASTSKPVAMAEVSAKTLADAAIPMLDLLRAARRRVLEFLNAVEGLDRGAVERAESEVASFTDALQLRANRLEEESQRSQQLKSLADAAVQARVEVTEQRFKAVQPLVADIFSRLDPHPAFKTIEFELDTYYRRGTTSPIVRDLVEGVSADPLLVFSTSQANIAALSYFLAMGWSAGERSLPFVLLDDPVQSLDDVNVLGFADLSRHLRKGRQLIISTHERRLAKLLERKLAPRSPDESTIVLDFLGWDRSGPTVEHRQVEPQLLNDPIRVVQAAS